MITEKLNNELINAMKAKVPIGTNLANFLMEILFIGKEAVYRRLRGEVPFTLSEAAIVSKKLGVSLDQLIGKSFKGNALFALNIINHAEPFDSYLSLLNEWSNVLYNIRKDKYSEMSTASNLLPNYFSMKYPLISKFMLFHWMYQWDLLNCVDRDCFDELVIPDEILEKQEEISNNIQEIKKTFFIWDKMMLMYFLNGVKYFKSINIFTDENHELMKKELLILLDELEDIVARGKYKTGNEVNIYVSNVNFETTYSYISSETTNICFIRVFGINSISTMDSDMSIYIKDWINSLKKFSTLISQSGEMQRIQFFKNQRDYINNM